MPEATPRSRLIGPAPVGTDSGRREGLIGYLVRLCRTHHVSPREMIRAEFLPQLARTGGVRFANFFSDYARTVHGNGPYAEDFVGVAERLTGRADLRALTWLAGRTVIPANSPGFLARKPRWCRHCLLQARVNRAYLSFPLVWSVDPYTVCGLHAVTLAERCVCCGRQQPFIPFLPDQSRCAHCGE